MKPGKKNEEPGKVRQQILDQLSAILVSHGDSISKLQYQRMDIPDKPSHTTIARHFGSWIKFKQAVFQGFSSGTKPELPNCVTEEFEEDNRGNTNVLTSKSKRIVTLDDALKHFNVDLDVWAVDRYTVNNWEVGARDENKKIRVTPLMQVKVWLKKKVETNDDLLKSEIKALIEEAKVFAPIYPVFKPQKFTDDRHLLEIAIMDLHLGKLCWSPEVGENYDSAIAESLYMNAIRDLVQKTNGYPVEEIVLPTGNDFFHIDKQDNTTTKGTRQDVDSRWQRASRIARRMLIEAIDALSVIAPVVVPIIPGNHDNERAFYLGEVLDAWYHHNSRVTIDNEPKPRKYHHYGVNLIGYTHGNEEKIDTLPTIMMREKKDILKDVEFMEWHIGHVHKSKETKYIAGDTFNGVSVRVIPSLCAADAWHHKKGYVKGIRAAEAYIWHHDTGYVGHFSSNVISKDK